MRRFLLLVLMIVMWSWAIPGGWALGSGPSGEPVGGSVFSDFNNDGFADLAIGVPLEDVGTLRDAGAVNVLYGSAGRLQATFPDDQFWHQDSPGVRGTPESDDRFGSSLGAGDFNSDGFADLAIGVREDVGTAAAAGAVNVLYGSAGGLQATSPDDQYWHQDSPEIQDTAETGDSFGSSLGAGDFNNDGFADLAIGVRAEDVVVGELGLSGAVSVLYGSAGGLQATSPDDQLWHQDSPDVQDTAEDIDLFGSSLGAGDFNSDGFADLTIGVLFEAVGTIDAAGAVNVLYGSSGGLQATSPNDQFWHQDSRGVRDTAEPVDTFGSSLGAGDFNSDGFPDLAIGVPGEDPAAGAVNVLYGSAGGLQATSPDDQFWHQGGPEVQDTREPDDLFGSSLGAGDFNNDGYADLAIGVSREDVEAIADAGAVNVLYGSAGGLQATSPDDQFWHQDAPDIQDTAESDDLFGSSLWAGEFNDNGFADLTIEVRSRS